MMLYELLTDIGLSPKESTLYLTLLRWGTQPTSFLAKKAGFNRGTAYVVLHSLLSKGLCMKTVKKKIQYFTPLEPQKLLSFLDHKKQELEHGKEKVKALMGEFLSITNPLTAKPKIEFFDGPEGARAVLEDTLTAKDKLLRAFLSIADVIEFAGGDFFDDYTQRRIAGGYSLHAIRTLEKDKVAFERDPRSKSYVTSPKEHREVRYAPEDLAFPMTMYMYDHKLAILSSKEEGFALLIESKELADMQKKLFELLWNSCKGKVVR